MKFFAILLLFSPLFASFPTHVSGPILYSMFQGESEKALMGYLTYAKQSGEEDYELLQEALFRLLERGMKTNDPANQLMCMFGAGISTNCASLPILQKGLENKELKIQLTALHYIAALNDDEADLLIESCLSSPHLLLRLEAALILAQKTQASIVQQMQSLYTKVDPRIRPVFAEVIAPVLTADAAQFLEKMMCDGESEVRLHTIIQAGVHKRDDLLPLLQRIALFPEPACQEAALWALLELQDSSSKALFTQMCKKQNPFIQLVAHKALLDMGEDTYLSELETQVAKANLFAFDLYTDTDATDKAKEVLVTHLSHLDPNVRLNAALGLLKWADPRALATLQELLIQKSHHKYVTQQFSPGRAMVYWVYTHGSPKSEMQTLGLRQKILRRTLELPENEFLKVAKMVFDQNQTDLIPLLIELLINQHTSGSIALLKEMQQKTGAPFIRNYCNLALYKLKIEGPYEENLLRFLRDEKNHPLIAFEERKKEAEEPFSTFTLKPEERSQLLIDCFETVASRHNAAGISALIHAIAYGHAQNRYALAGLLIRTLE